MGWWVKHYLINMKMRVWNPAPKETSGRCIDPCVTLIVGVLTCVYVVLGRWRRSPDQAAWLDEVHQ